jgi:hypothetical protein
MYPTICTWWYCTIASPIFLVRRAIRFLKEGVVMNIRASVVSSFAVTFVLAVGSRSLGCASAPDGAEAVGTDSAALDDFRNCTYVGNDDYDCAPTNPGAVTNVFNNHVYTLQTLGRDQTATVTNTGPLALEVFVEQGLAWGTPVLVQPGQMVNVAPIDNNYFSWDLFSVLIQAPPQLASLAGAKVRLHVGAFTPAHTACNDACTTRVNGCHAGCALDEHANAWCKAGCDFAYNVCLTDCSHAGN